MTRTFALIAILFCAREAAAQSPDFTSLRVHGKPTIYVTDYAGQTLKGKLSQWTASRLEIYDGTAMRSLALPDVARIERNDSLKNGMLIGGSIGVLAGVIGHGFTDCQFDRRCARGTRAIALGPLGLAAWVGIGTAIDALIPGRRPLWP